MSAKYKLTYFNGRGLGELIRLILAQAGVDYEDVRIERDKWSELKPKMPFSRIPVLEVNGKIIAESRAIARYVARQHGLAGKDDLEAALCDMIVDAVYDVRSEMRPYSMESEEAEKPVAVAEMAIHAKPAPWGRQPPPPWDLACLQTGILKKFFTEVLPSALERVEKMLAANNGGKAYIVGSNLTWADIALANYLSDMKKINPRVLDGHKLLENFCDRILNLPKIKKWIETRPETAF